MGMVTVWSNLGSRSTWHFAEFYEPEKRQQARNHLLCGNGLGGGHRFQTAG